MRPTALGWKALVFQALLTTAFYVSPYTNLFFLLLSFFATLLGLSALWTRTNVRGVRGRIEVPRTIPAEVDHGRVEVELTARRVRRALEIVLEVDGLRRPVPIAFVDALPASNRTRVAGRLPPLRRGVHRVGRAFVRSSAPTGFWRSRVRIDAPAEITVYAAPLDAHAAREQRLLGDGDELAGATAASNSAGASGLREWRTGDPLRAVHWRATARRRTPIVREYETSNERVTSVVLDRRVPDESLERGLSELVTLALVARDGGRRLVVRSQGLTASFGAGAEPIESLLHWTATAQVSQDPPPPAPPDTVQLPTSRSGAPA